MTCEGEAAMKETVTKETIMEGTAMMDATKKVAGSAASQQAWEALAEEERRPSEEYSAQFDSDAEKAICAMRDLADGYGAGADDPGRTARIMRALDGDVYTSWDTALMPLEGHGMRHGVDKLGADQQPARRTADEVLAGIRECDRIERDGGRHDRSTGCRRADRARRMVAWLEPKAEDYDGLPRVRAIAMLVRACGGIMRERDRSLPGAWRDDPIGKVALAVAGGAD